MSECKDVFCATIVGPPTSAQSSLVVGDITRTFPSNSATGASRRARGRALRRRRRWRNWSWLRNCLGCWLGSQLGSRLGCGRSSRAWVIYRSNRCCVYFWSLRYRRRRNCFRCLLDRLHWSRLLGRPRCSDSWCCIM